MKVRISKIRTKKGFGCREIDREEVRRLAQSMKARDQLRPILLNKDFELIDGAHRLAAAKLLGWREIDAEFVKKSDLECHRLSLVSNRFGRPLTDLEIGRKAHFLLSQVQWNKGRDKLKIQLVEELGLSSISKLEDCLATYRGLQPNIQKVVSYAVRKGTLKTEEVRKLRTLPPKTQTFVAKRITELKDPGRISKLISGLTAMGEQPSSESEETSTGSQNPDATATPSTQEDRSTTRVVEPQTEKKDTPSILALAVSLHLPWLRYVTAITKCPKCREERAIDFSEIKLATTSDQLLKIREEMQRWLDENREAA
jgi:ParB-like chromosome segregation protein Spo0J